MPPTINNYYGHTSVNRHCVPYLKPAAKKYREKVKKIVRENNWDFQANVPIKVFIVFNFCNRRRNDLDNRLKGLLDACTHSNIWDDDSLIDECHMIRGSSSCKSENVLLQVQAMEDVNDDD